MAASTNRPRSKAQRSNTGFLLPSQAENRSKGSIHFGSRSLVSGSSRRNAQIPPQILARLSRQPLAGERYISRNSVALSFSMINIRCIVLIVKQSAAMLSRRFKKKKKVQEYRALVPFSPVSCHSACWHFFLIFSPIFCPPSLQLPLVAP